MGFRRIIGMPFNAKFIIGMPFCIFKNSFNQSLKIFRRKKSWRSSAKMQFSYYRHLIHQLKIELPFLEDGINIIIFHGMIGGNFFIATTISAQCFAKRQMKVKAYTAIFILLQKIFPEILLSLEIRRQFIPERNGWVTCVAWNRGIVFGQ